MNFIKICIWGTNLLILIWGCKTRDPESPTQGTSGFKPPVTPEIVLENFKTAIKENKVDYYMRCFIDTTASSKSFSFNPSVGYETYMLSWNLEAERRYFQNLSRTTSGEPFLNFSDSSEANRTPSSIEYDMEYFLYFPHQQPNVSTRVKGYMHLYLEVDNQQRWAIYRWDDVKTVTDSTWSYLKFHLNY